jgi:hypothetical protein
MEQLDQWASDETVILANWQGSWSKRWNGNCRLQFFFCIIISIPTRPCSLCRDLLTALSNEAAGVDIQATLRTNVELARPISCASTPRMTRCSRFCRRRILCGVSSSCSFVQPAGSACSPCST